MIFGLYRALSGSTNMQKALKRHFGVTPSGEIVTAGRSFPIASRVDVQKAITEWMQARGGAALLGIHTQMGHETLTLASLCSAGPFPIDVGPLQYDEVDVGDDVPVRCLKNGLWLARQAGMPFALLMAPAMMHGMTSSVHVEAGVLKGEAGARFSEEFFREMEARVAEGKTYRGRVISLESGFDYSGRGGAVKVHRLQRVVREDVILPEKTLRLLDRNVGEFIAARDQIKAMRFSAKKGLLFYGPPGTGKTLTIHYLAAQLEGHTTLLVTAEQVGLLGEYFRLARFLQPSIMVIEDVDLIARERAHLQTPGQEMMLNKLLNEMDGLREDADVIFILTTNRPDELEPALAARPGRIDQAIEFPLPDEDGRGKLVRLYSRGLEVPVEVETSIVSRTKGASAAFIRELMRRSAQFQVENGDGHVLAQRSVEGALEEMLILGGTLNLKLLGGTLQ